MDAQPQSRLPYHRLGRWTRGQVREIDLTTRDLDYLFAFFRFGMLASDMLHALVTPTIAQRITTDRLFLLKNPPNRYLVQPEAQARLRNANAAPLVYELAPKGALALLDHGRISHGDYLVWRKVQAVGKPLQFAHDAAIGHVLASLQLGLREAGLRFIAWHDILGRERCPMETRQAASPLAIPYDGARMIVPDALFGIEYPEGACFFALELDRGTEQQAEAVCRSTTIERKLSGYRQLLRDEAHRTRFALPNLQVLFVTTGIVRATHMIEQLRVIAARDGCGSTHAFHFNAMPQLARSNIGALPVSGDLLRSQWTRAHHPQRSLAVA